MLDTWQQTHRAWTDDAEPAWLASLRKQALARFADVGWPSTRLEAWKYTSTRALSELELRHADAPDDDAVRDLVEQARVAHALAELVFVDGQFSSGLSRLGDLPEGVRVETVSQAVARGDDLSDRLGRLAAWSEPADALTALNVAFLQDGLLVQVDDGVRLDAPIHVVAASTGSGAPVVAHLRHLIAAGTSSQVAVVETFVGREGEATLTNVVTEIDAGPNAEVHHHVAGLGASTAHLVHDLEARLDRDARGRLHVAWLGGAITRSQVRVTLAGPGSDLALDGLYVLGGRQHVDNHTVIEHATPHTTSREAYKGVLGGRSKGVFDGIVIVRPDAQHTDSAQSAHTLLVSDDADANAKPTLEIYADDVKCSHGSTVGQLDDVQLQYLRSRGIPAEQARRMLTAAFADDRVLQLSDEALRGRLLERVHAQLDHTLEAM